MEHYISFRFIIIIIISIFIFIFFICIPQQPARRAVSEVQQSYIV